MADDSQISQNGPRSNKMVKHIHIISKIIEVILAIFAIGLIVDPLNSFQKIFNKPRFKLDDAAVVYTSVAGYLMINMIFIISYVLGDRVPKRTLILFASVGAIMHLVAGSVLIHNWRRIMGPYYHLQNNEIYPSKMYMDMMISGAIFTFVNALVFFLEIFLTIKYGSKASH